MNQPNSAALPADMRYIDHGRGGGPEVLVPQRAPLPVPGADEPDLADALDESELGGEYYD